MGVRDPETGKDRKREREKHRSRKKGRQGSGHRKRGCQESWAKEQAQRGTFSVRNIKWCDHPDRCEGRSRGRESKSGDATQRNVCARRPERTERNSQQGKAGRKKKKKGRGNNRGPLRGRLQWT